jgi:hypothetical protein
VSGGTSKTIALVDWTWTGHHPTYFKFYASALAELGATVVPFLPQPDELPDLIASTPIGQSPLRAKRIHTAARFTAGRRLPIRPKWLQRWQQQAFHFAGLQRALAAWEKTHQRTIDLVFFACIYEADFDQLRTAAPLFKRDWAGLHLHASEATGGSPGSLSDPLQSPRLRGLAVLDPTLVSRLSSRIGGKPIVAFPDLVDAEVPAPDDPDNGLAKKILAFAAGRKIVSVMGHLKLVKGLEAFTQAAADPRLQDVLFFLGGEVALDGAPRPVRSALMRAWEQRPNIYAHLQRLDERPFNAALNASDLVYAAYVDFPFSSNVLTKAALFHKPIIVSDGHLMGERVATYKLGRVVPQRDGTAVAEAILSLLHNAPDQKCSARYDDFAALHSYDRLKQSFTQLLAAIA